MRLGSRKSQFDVSDVTESVDTMDDVLDIAMDTSDHNSPSGRMARWLILNIGETPSLPRCAELARNHDVLVMGSNNGVRVFIDGRKSMSPADARYLAAQILRAAARAEA